MKKITILATVFVLIFSCQSVKSVQDDTVEETPQIIKSMYEEGVDLIENFQLAAFTDLYNRALSENLEDSKKLKELFITSQKNLFNKLIADDHYKQAKSIYRNLKALGEANGTMLARLDNIRPEKEAEAAIRMPGELNDYLSLVGSIEIERKYKNKDGMERNSYPLFAGSGFYINNTQIATAYHVVEVFHNPDNIKCQMFFVDSVGYRTEITLDSWDEINDIAVLTLKKEAKHIPNISHLLGNSDDLRHGDEVFVLANPYGYTTSMTKGIISNPERKAPEFGNWVQLDASVAPGSSGGLVIGKDMKVYGIVLAGVISEEINFAVPSNVIQKSISQLEDGVNNLSPWLGLISSSQLEIECIAPASPFNTLPQLHGKKIKEVNGYDVFTALDVQNILSEFAPGDICSIKFQESDAEYLVPLSTRPRGALVSAFSALGELDTMPLYFGINLNEDETVKQNIYENGKSLTVTLYKVISIEADSFLYSRGVRTDDYVGILDSDYTHTARYLSILHLPNVERNIKISDINDYIYTTVRSNYEENTL